MRTLLALLVGVLLGGCTSVPQKPAEDPAVTPIAVLGVAECGVPKGIVVTTKDGKMHPRSMEGLTIEQLQAIADSLPPGSVGTVNLTDNCAPKQTT